MKRIVALTVVMMFSACTQIGNGIVQEGIPKPDPVVNPPDPVITTPINSRFTGKIDAAVTGSAQEKYDFDSILEFREKSTGRLIGYTQARDKLQNGKLIIDFWAEGQRNNADVTLNIPNPNPKCDDIVLKGKLDFLGNIAIPKTVQKLNCRIFFGVSITVTTEATVFTRVGEANKFNWKAIEAYFAGK
jgi:hypothetical protein